MATYLTIRQAVGAAGTVANVVNGTAIDIIGVPSVLTLYGNGEIVGMSHSITIFVGGQNMQPIPSSALPLASTAGSIKKDEDFIARFPVPGGARLVHFLSNPGAASNADFLYILESGTELAFARGLPGA